VWSGIYPQNGLSNDIPHRVLVNDRQRGRWAINQTTIVDDSFTNQAIITKQGIIEMTARTNISSGGKWEPIIGYSRAVRVGPFVFVSGCTASTPAGLVGIGDPYAQTVQTLATIKSALESAGASLAHVVRTRIYLTRMSDWQTVGKAHGEVFGTVLPATAIVEVKGLIDPQMLVEIEADAVIPE
jgi:enamine deaminase RidA (YjgF/YER057c/UK114 family)